MEQFDKLQSTSSDESLHSSCDADEELAPKPFCWKTSKLGFIPSVNEELGVEEGFMGGLEQENDMHASVGFGFMKEMECTYSNALGGSSEATGRFSAVQTAMRKFLPSNNDDDHRFFTEPMAEDVDFYSCDEFRMYDFKVRKCMRGRSHDWTDCPFAHPGEKAKRRDPRLFHYSGSACPDFRKGNCRKGDACEYAHGVFECWLHPARYRTQLCRDGKACTRKVCFFAHTPSQLRVLAVTSTTSRSIFQAHSLKALVSGSYDGSPLRQALAGSVFDGVPGHDTPGNRELYEGSLGCSTSKNSHLGVLGKLALGGFCGTSQISSPTSTLVGHTPSPPALSPPLSPSESPPMSPDSPSGWSNALAHRRIPCLSTAQVLHRQASFDPHVALLEVQACLAQYNSPVAIGARGPSLLSSNGAVNRRHLERLNSMPTVSVSRVARASDHGLSKEMQSPHAQTMNQLIATLQQLELKRAAESFKGGAEWLSSSHQFSRSVPGSPNTRLAGTWNVHDSGENTLPIVGSGRELRAKIYGRLRKEAPLESEIPDFGWVNELVK